MSYSPRYHFKRWIEAYKEEEASISEDNINKIKSEIEENGPLDLRDLTPNTIRRYMRNLRLNDYRDNADYISYKLTGQKPPPLTSDELETLMRSFDEL